MAPTGPVNARTKEPDMADLIAIGYDDEQTAHRAAEEVERLAQDLSGLLQGD
jgi:uncharacterized membrane protein